MKELTIKQKAQRYDEAVKKLKIMHDDWAATQNRAAKEVEDVFPELAESKNEKIKKIIKQSLKSYFDGKLSIGTNDIDYALCLSWLEKQGNNINIIYNKELSKLLHIVICRYVNDPDISYTERDNVSKKIFPYVELLEKQGEPVEINPTEFDIRLQALIGKFDSLPKEELIGSLSFWMNVVQNGGTYKSDGWSEEDERLFDCVVWNLRYSVNNRDIEHSAGQLEDWLKSLKDRVQPKQEWSEKEQQIIKDAACFILSCVNTAVTKKEEERLEELADKLQDLRPQNWKPSDEQMRALDIAIRCGIQLGSSEEIALRSLLKQLEDLKKLREE